MILCVYLTPNDHPGFYAAGYAEGALDHEVELNYLEIAGFKRINTFIVFHLKQFHEPVVFINFSQSLPSFSQRIYRTYLNFYSQMFGKQRRHVRYKNRSSKVVIFNIK
jgi:hypothetical protein